MRGTLVITTKGTLEFKKMNPKEDYHKWCKALNCDIIDEAEILERDILPQLKNYTLIIDDVGLWNNEYKTNFLASYLYGCTHHGKELVGPVAIAKNGQDNFYPLNAKDVAYIKNVLTPEQCKNYYNRAIHILLAMFIARHYKPV